MGKELEIRPITDPKAFVEELDARVRAMDDPETKYNFQIELKEVGFKVDEEKARELGLSFPVQSIAEAERALREGVLNPTRLVELVDKTSHQVIEFDPRPIAYSGFANCVTHSLALTDRGLFELGRYSARRSPDFTKIWSWFLHRRVLTTEEVEGLENAGMSSQEILDLFCTTVYMRVAVRSR